MPYEYKKVNSNTASSTFLTMLASQGWEVNGKLDDKLDKDGNVLIEKSHFIRFRRVIGAVNDDDVILNPEKVFARIGVRN